MFLLITILSIMAIATPKTNSVTAFENTIVFTERWGEVESSSLQTFHDAYALFLEKKFILASEGFRQLITDQNYYLADEAKWYFAETLLLRNHDIEKAFKIYMELALDENSSWGHVSRDKIMIPQFKKLLLNL